MKIVFLGFFIFLMSIPSLWAQEQVRRWPPPDSFFVLSKEPMIVNLDEVRPLIGFPKELVEAEIEGKVVVRILFDETGKYIQHIVLRDPHPLLTKTFTDVVPLMTATSAEICGRPVACWVTIPYDPHFLR